jgi:hypothetical protein
MLLATAAATPSAGGAKRERPRAPAENLSHILVVKTGLFSAHAEFEPRARAFLQRAIFREPEKA